MSIILGGGNQKKDEQPNNNEIIKRIVTVLQKLEEEFLTNKRNVNTKINGNNFSLTEKLRELNSVIESIDTRVSVIGERTPEELTTEPIRNMISEGYLSIQVKGSADLLNKSAELAMMDQSLAIRISEDEKKLERVSLSLATDIVGLDERTSSNLSQLRTRIDEINMVPSSSHNVVEMQNQINLLMGEVEKLKRQNEELSDKLSREMYTEMNHRMKAVESLNNRISYGS